MPTSENESSETLRPRELHEIPKALQGLGLNQRQLMAVQRYIALRVHYSRNQRRILLVLCLVLTAQMLVQYALPGADTSNLPYESVLATILRWSPLCLVTLGVISLGVQQAIVYHLRKCLPELGLTARAVNVVNDLGDSVARYAFFYNKLAK